MTDRRLSLEYLVRLPLGHPARRSLAVDPLGGAAFLIDSRQAVFVFPVAGRHALCWSADEEGGLRRHWRWHGLLPADCRVAIQHPGATRIRMLTPGVQSEQTELGLTILEPATRDRLDVQFDGPAQTGRHWDDLLYPKASSARVRLVWHLPEKPRLYTHPFDLYNQHVSLAPGDGKATWLWTTSADRRTAWQARLARFLGTLNQPDAAVAAVARRIAGKLTEPHAASQALIAWLADHFTTLPITSPVAKSPGTLLEEGRGNAEDRAILLSSMLRSLAIENDIVFVDATKRTDIQNGWGLPGLTYCFVSAFDAVGIHLWCDHPVMDPDEQDGMPRHWDGCKALRLRANGAVELLIL
ncbi:transglutaminase-like domain-containing protein [Metallibacterium scheffleri]